MTIFAKTTTAIATNRRMAHGSREIEIKLALPDAREARRLLRAAGFHISRPRVLEQNVVFDTPGRAISRSGRLIRLRQAGKVATLTYKGPPGNSRHKSREERETEVADPRAMALILEQLGLEPAFHYDKFRTEYRARAAGAAMLDETPIGVYLELEGPPRWIDATARKMGFREADYITDSYGRLYRDWCVEHGGDPDRMVFGKRSTSKR
jgi:adenylate cyclase class 2